MKKTLRPFQSAGAAFLASRYHALLADEPGLGKTVQAIRAAELVPEIKRVRVVCPASVRLNWHQEISECLGADPGRKWEVISYNLASSPNFNADRALPVDALILDEAHFLKTPDSKRTQAIFGNGTGLARKAKYVWALTGTPVLNRPRELYPVLKTLAPEFAATSYAAYTQRYCGAFFDGRGINDKGATHLDELAGKLEKFMLRRTKREVMPELPPKVLSRVPLEVKAEDLRELRAEEDLVQNREAKLSSIAEDFSQLGDMSRLLRLTGLSKVNAAVDFVDELLDGVDKVVIFARHREVISRLELLLGARRRKAVVYHGGMSDDQKAQAVRDFQRPEISAFIGQIQAAGTGINGLQEVASHVVFAELSWVPGETGQAVDRCHRIGQAADSVNVYFLHAPGTLESAVLAVHGQKEQVIERLMGDSL